MLEKKSYDAIFIEGVHVKVLRVLLCDSNWDILRVAKMSDLEVIEEVKRHFYVSVSYSQVMEGTPNGDLFAYLAPKATCFSVRSEGKCVV